ncbi:histidine kinase [Micromonospora sp. BRA006-A]|nr:histidine kinase [Micromonospora sp. BRA006-A]
MRVWRDWALSSALVVISVVEMLLRDDRAWAPLLVGVSVVVAACLLYRRTRPLAAVTVAFETVLAFDIARSRSSTPPACWASQGCSYCPTPCCAGERVARLPSGSASSSSGHPSPSSRRRPHPAEGRRLRLLPGLGRARAAVRYRTRSHDRDVEQVRLHQRNELARELHDTVGHHVSAIAVQAQTAGRALAAADPSARWPPWSPSRKRRPGRSGRCEPSGGAARRYGRRSRPSARGGGHRTTRSRRR